MGETLKLVAHAVFNEFDTDLGGTAGDQIGSELNAIRWYSHPWTSVYRAINEEHREIIANFMQNAIPNGFIGYDTNKFKRETLFDVVCGNGFRPELINQLVHTDCSALVFCPVYQITGVDFVPNKDNNTNKVPRVSDYVTYFETTCPDFFEKLTDEKYLTSDEYLLRGDILVYLNADNTVGHIAVLI